MPGPTIDAHALATLGWAGDRDEFAARWNERFDDAAGLWFGHRRPGGKVERALAVGADAAPRPGEPRIRPALEVAELGQDGRTIVLRFVPTTLGPAIMGEGRRLLHGLAAACGIELLPGPAGLDLAACWRDEARMLAADAARQDARTREERAVAVRLATELLALGNAVETQVPAGLGERLCVIGGRLLAPVEEARERRLAAVPLQLPHLLEAVRARLEGPLKRLGVAVRIGAGGCCPLWVSCRSGPLRHLLKTLMLETAPDLRGGTLELTAHSHGTGDVSLSLEGRAAPGEVAALAPLLLEDLRRRTGVLGRSVELSERNVGSWRLTIPLRESSGVMRRPVAEARVLLVEDDALSARLAGAMLDRLGIVGIERAENGREALELVQSRAYDAVLMDCQMPVMDGLEATQRIRGLSGAASQLPIVALTGNEGSQSWELCRISGMDAWCPKPVRLETLRAALERWLEIPELAAGAD